MQQAPQDSYHEGCGRMKSFALYSEEKKQRKTPIRYSALDTGPFRFRLPSFHVHLLEEDKFQLIRCKNLIYLFLIISIR